MRNSGLLRGFLLVSCSFLVASCSPATEPSTSPILTINDVTTHVYEYDDNGNYITPTLNWTAAEEAVTYTYEGKNIRVEDDGQIVGLKADTTTVVTATTASGYSTTFNVNVENRAYTSSHAEAEESEGWFDDISVDKITMTTTEDFINGMDISSAKQLYDNDQKFYNADGIEQSLFGIIYDAGVNWIRLRLWVDPYDYTEDADGNITKTFLYGGGNCDYDHVLWMAKEAVFAGLKFKLDFHYSDYWADPNDQIIPKRWADCTTSDELAERVYDYTKETLEGLEAEGCLPDMVSIGNELVTGLFLQSPGGTTTDTSAQVPNYSENKTSAPSALRAYAGSTNFVKYLKRASEAVRAVSEDILIMVHYVKGFSDPNTTINFYNGISSVDFDVIGLSGYVYWHFGRASVLESGLNSISAAFPNKKICIAETSYGFTYEEDSWANNTFTSSLAMSGYPVSIQGQANVIRDVSNAVSKLSNGLGVFYWESAWTPTKYSGWAARTSRISWANQALFSYDGKATGALSVYSQML